MVKVNVEVPDEVYERIKQLQAEEAMKGNKSKLSELTLFLVQQGICQQTGQPSE